MKYLNILILLVCISASFYVQASDNDKVEIQASCVVGSSTKLSGKGITCTFSAYGQTVTYLSALPNSHLSFFLNTTDNNPDCASNKNSFTQIKDIQKTETFINNNPNWCVGVLAAVDGVAVASFAHHGSSFKDNALHQKTVKLQKEKDSYSFVAE